VSRKFEVDGCVEAKKTGDERIVAVVETWAHEKVEKEARSRDEGSEKKRLNIWRF
jgi:hypothetical protein